jgi:hypothetical protein
MKKLLYGLVLSASILLTACSQTRYVQDSYQDSYSDEPYNSISYQQFYDDLDPYGQWVNSLEFGSVWVPRLSGFQPYYTNGHWAYTNYGWTWVSNYDWGWAPFHYGRWYYDNFYGWAWVPGYEWAPAWVNWRSNSQYYGWSPLCPQTRDGRYYQIRNDQWAFVPRQYINRRNLDNYYVSPRNNITIINNTTEINNVRVINNNTKYQEGPGVAEVERATKARVIPLAVKQSTVPGNAKIENGALRIFKPAVKQTDITTDNRKPVKVTSPSASQAEPGSTQPTPNTTSPVRPVRKFDEGKIINNNEVKANTPAVNTDDKPSNFPDKTTRQFPTEPNINRVRPSNEDVNVQQVPQENKTNTNINERRVVVPRQTPGNIQREERINYQRQVQQQRQIQQQNQYRQQQNQSRQQNPSLNQRPAVRERPAPDFNRSSGSFEQRRPQVVVPNNSSQIQSRFNKQRDEK